MEASSNCSLFCYLLLYRCASGFTYLPRLVEAASEVVFLLACVCVFVCLYTRLREIGYAVVTELSE